MHMLQLDGSILWREGEGVHEAQNFETASWPNAILRADAFHYSDLTFAVKVVVDEPSMMTRNKGSK